MSKTILPWALHQIIFQVWVKVLIRNLFDAKGPKNWRACVQLAHPSEENVPRLDPLNELGVARGFDRGLSKFLKLPVDPKSFNLQILLISTKSGTSLMPKGPKIEEPVSN